MNTLEKPFEVIGARVKVRERRGQASEPRARFPLGGTPVRKAAPVEIDIRTDRHGEFFDVVLREGQLAVIDTSKDRHLLLLHRIGREKAKFLCGHDERHWFVAAVLEAAAASTVTQAKLALKPDRVALAEERQGLRLQARLRRHTAVALRQGEWFFVPAPTTQVDEKHALRNEPLQRGRARPHIAERLVRYGGEQVYWHARLAPNGISADAYGKIISEVRTKARKVVDRVGWRRMVRGATVFVNGKIRHPDHKTLVLDGWHRVEMNRETEAKAMEHVAFLD